jgi:hypothetical protein
MCDSCAICLNPVRVTRNTTQLPCEHLFHKKCLSGWENKGGDRCPLCRKTLNGNNYRVTLTIENLNRDVSNTIPLSIETLHNVIERLNLDESDLAAFSTEINFDVENLEDLEAVMSDLGIGITDLDASILDTE